MIVSKQVGFLKIEIQRLKLAKKVKLKTTYTRTSANYMNHNRKNFNMWLEFG